MAEVVLARSVQRRVALVSALVVGIALTVGMVGMELVESMEHQQMLDGRLKHLAGTIVKFVDDTPEYLEASTSKPSLQHGNEAREASIYVYQAWSRSGHLLFESPQSPISKPLARLDTVGFDSVSINGEMHRVFSLVSPSGSVVVQVAESLRERADDLSVTIKFYLLTLLLPFGVSMAATWLLLRGSFRSLDGLAQSVRQHQLLDTQPAINDSATKEFAPVFQAIDALFQRTGQALLMEQRFSSTAAHELRTPWAGIRAHAQIASRAQNQEELQAALKSIVRGVDRASHMLDQLFDLSRVDNMSKALSSSFQRVRLASIYDEVFFDLGSKAAAKQISITENLPEANIQGIDFAIFLLLRNLVSNAILYTPAGGQVEVSVQRTGPNVILTVDDSGKGIPADVREHAFERFNRLGQQGAEGIGLGLSIVAQIVELHHAKIQLLDSPLGGLRAQVTFK